MPWLRRKREAHDKLVARTEQAQAAATAAIQKVDRDIKAANQTVVANWNGLKAKVAADMAAWNTKLTKFAHEQDVKGAQNYAELMEWEASFAVDCANAAIGQASLLFSMLSSLVSKRIKSKPRDRDEEAPRDRLALTST